LEQERDELITKHKREMENLMLSKVHDHSLLLATKQEQAKEVTRLLSIHYTQHKQYTPDIWRKRYRKSSNHITYYKGLFKMTSIRKQKKGGNRKMPQ
jgi:hypothetical protein